MKNWPEYRLRAAANWRARNRAKCAAATAKWQQENPARSAFQASKYRAAKLQRTPKWLTEDHWEAIQRMFDKAARHSIETGIPHEVDHIVPLRGDKVSGLHVPWNLQILSKSDNCSKNKYGTA